VEHVANDDHVEDNITIIHIIKAGNNNNNNNNNNILYRETRLINVVKLKYVGKPVTNNTVDKSSAGKEISAS